MGISFQYRDDVPINLSWNEMTGAIGDSVTVLSVVVVVAALTDISSPGMERNARTGVSDRSLAVRNPKCQYPYDMWNNLCKALSV